MLLIDPTDLSVYKLPEASITNANGAPVHTISFNQFEKAAQQSYSNLILEPRQGTEPCIRASSIVFVHLRGNSNTFAWASRICVQHTYEYPNVHNWTLGGEFLLLWPAPIAIHTWLSFKERARICNNNLDTPSLAVVDHPPALSQLNGLAGIAHVGKVEPCDLTVAQRFFVASLRPNLPHFATRQPGDDWSSRLSDADATARKCPCAAPSAKRSTSSMTPLTHGTATLDLPYELIARIVSMRLSEDLCVIETAVTTVARLSAVSRQFCACTRDATRRMLDRVHPLCMNLHGSHPKSPAWVQAMLCASGLTLRSTFALDLGKWHVFVRQRRALVTNERASCSDDDSARRHALLWD